MRSLAIIHEIDEINAAGFLPGVRLGYLMCDTCSFASKALGNVEHMLESNKTLNVKCNYTDFRPKVKIILGASNSDVSIALAGLLNVYMVPLVSHKYSKLSDKLRFPSFMRTIPSDKHQTKAVAKMMKHYDWNWVGVVYGDDEYGKAAFQSFLTDAEANNVCLAYQEVLPHYLDNLQTMQRIEQVAAQIRSSNAQVVLLILKSDLVEGLFKEMIRTNTSRIWIASDAWSRSISIARMDSINKVGDILGFTFLSGKSDSFEKYLKNLTATPGGYNYFIEEYKNLRFNCTSECDSKTPPSYCSIPDLRKIQSGNACNFTDPQEQNDDYLVNALDTSQAFLHKVILISLTITIHPSFFQLFRKTKFSGTKTIPNMYRQSLYRLISNGNLRSLLLSQIPQSRCSQRCAPGSVKKIFNTSCCYSCIPCVEGTYSDEPDLQNCKTCPNGTWSLKNWSECKPRTESYMKWSDPHPIVMMAAAAFGILLLLVTFIIFLVYRDSPPMKRAEVRLSCVMMAGLSVSFASVICFMGKPSVHFCRARQVMYAMGFTLCVSCILVKAYRTFLAFLPFGQLTSRQLHKLYHPPAIVIIITTLQGIICLLWLIFDSPDIDDTPPPPQSMTILVHCDEGNTYIGFGIMLSYIALLSLICFLLAIKGRKVPQEVSETGYIIFSMLMYLFVWVCFIPVYITNSENGTPVQASAILVSSYGIIFCHFLPKCYEALWGSKTDTMEKILRKWHVIRSPNLDSVTEIDIDIPGKNTYSQKSDRFSISSTSTILRSSGTPSEISHTDSVLDIMDMSNEKINAYLRLRTNIRKRCISF
uniref:G-protein coupled receptor family C group 6 member A n=1 Tax=Sander lucioperca TaxID=283035 RepID=A0A8C9Z2N7_SANLU